MIVRMVVSNVDWKMFLKISGESSMMRALKKLKNYSNTNMLNMYVPWTE